MTAAIGVFELTELLPLRDRGGLVWLGVSGVLDEAGSLAETHSTGFLRFKTSASMAHINSSTCDDGGDSATPFSMS
jgi:hypothetical protein